MDEEKKRKLEAADWKTGSAEEFLARDINYDELDPGIREVVRMLNDEGFVTTDSGDGVHKLTPEFRYPNGNKPDENEVHTHPHVVISCDAPILLVATAKALRKTLEDKYGVWVSSVGQGDVFIQASYDPTDDSAFIELVGLNDELLKNSVDTLNKCEELAGDT